jgi:hypothetical protein
MDWLDDVPGANGSSARGGLAGLERAFQPGELPAGSGLPDLALLGR